MGNRVKRRAKSIKRPFDVITKDGTLVRGVIYFDDLKPEIRYREKLRAVNRLRYLRKLKGVKDSLQKDFKINKKMITVDSQKLRILTSVKIVEQIRNQIDRNLLRSICSDKKLLGKKELVLAIVEE